eukprot:4589074-Lingulodinium_polyedra.AAC.1
MGKSYQVVEKAMKKSMKKSMRQPDAPTEEHARDSEAMPAQDNKTENSQAPVAEFPLPPRRGVLPFWLQTQGLRGPGRLSSTRSSIASLAHWKCES